MSYMNEQRKMIQEVARNFAMSEVLPIANRLDPERGEIPMALRDKMAELGFFGILIPEEYGGLGLGAFEYCLVTEELARAWMSVGSIIRHSTAGSLLPVDMMTPYQREKYLRKMALGDYLIAFAMSEPSTGSDVSNISCRAVRDGDSWLLTGNKYWCTFADAADGILVIARSDQNIDPKRRFAGLTAFLVEKERGKFPEGMSGQAIPKIGYFGWKTFELALDNVRVPAENVMGEEGKAFYMVSKGLEKARAQTAARAIGLARGALEDATAYAGERQQFGRPIGDFQAIRFKLAKMAAEVEASRQLMYHVCDEIDGGRRCDKEAAMVKYLATEMAEQVASEGLQIHGGGGYTTLFAAERYWRDARLTKIFEGTSEIQLRIISDHLLGKAKS
ncbi:acyl-CoA dehydrogenase family protein [Bradyrhizobium commune]|uniref:Acyl-CoA dehydrogenase family protein n=2 Tax=Bradyrhizobium commune TaxID=83627 RepID=A0A7S9GYA8_9BRAD|nr:acyl-CoA dehydrogenase family protein [Bradyrhizobium commune]